MLTKYCILIYVLYNNETLQSQFNCDYTIYQINMKETLIKQMIELLNRKDVKNEIKKFITPLTDIVISDLYPWLYLIVLFVFFIFFIILANLVILITILRNKMF